MMIIKGFPHILHGGDWNPDQWIKEYPEVISRDFELMDKASCNTFSIGMFSWGQIETEEGVFDFSWLDDIMDRCAEHGKNVFLATPSAARPGWMGQKYPDSGIMDASGRRMRWSGRQTACLNSPAYRSGVFNINTKLAERYAGHPALAGWHLSNEYSSECFCERCMAKFHDFLKRRYGTLDNLNRCYCSAFWGHNFSDWGQVNPADTALDLAPLDWMRFVTADTVEFFRMEAEAIRNFSGKPVSSNMMGTFGLLNYFEIAKWCDFIGDDCYPCWYTGDVEREAARFSFLHDMHYTMQDKPFIVFESCPGMPNYHPYTKMRRPNELVREMHLALGHGADGTMYFQWRKSRGNAEKIHGAVVGHEGTDSTRTFREVADYGRRLAGISGIVDSGRRQETAVIFDWESMWALRYTKGFEGEKVSRYEETVNQHYRAMWKHNADLAVISPDFDFDRYKIIAAPMLFMLRGDTAVRLKDFVRRGGTLVMTYLSAYVDENNVCFPGGNPGGGLRELAGILNEDIDGFEPGIKQSFDFDGQTFEVTDFAEYIHSGGAETLAVYNHEFYAGYPAVTVNCYGRGRVFYIGGRTGLDFLRVFYGKLLAECGVSPVLAGVPETLSVSRRIASDGTEYFFVINLTPQEQYFKLPCVMEDIWHRNGSIREITLPPSGSTVLKK